MFDRISSAQFEYGILQKVQTHELFVIICKRETHLKTKS